MATVVGDVSPAPQATRGLVGRSSAYGAGILLSRLTGLLREILLARTLGTSAGASALVVAQIYPNLVRGLVGDEVSQGAMAPVLADLRASEQAALARATCRAFSLLSTLALTVVAALMLPWSSALVASVASDLPGPARAQAADMIRLLVPVVAASGLAASGAAMLLLEGRVGVLAGLNAVSNLPLIALLVVVPNASPQQAALLVSAGLCLQAVSQYVMGMRGGDRATGSLQSYDRGAVRGSLQRILRLALPVALTLGAANLSGLIDTAFAVGVGTDGPAAYDKAFRLMLLPYGVLSLAISVAVMPALLHASGDRFRYEVRSALSLQLALVLPVAVLLGLAAEPLVALAFGRGKFDQASIEATSEALRGMAFVIPALGVSALGTRAWTTRALPWVPAAASAAALAGNAALDALLVGPLGLFGLAVATAIVHALLGLGLLMRADITPCGLRGLRSAVMCTVPSIIAGVGTYFFSLLISPASPVACILSLIPCFGLLFVVTAITLRVPQYARLWETVRGQDRHDT